ncbi:hypothetical protein K7X08_009074 [Anisodus acutangulus]|uniref:Helicase MAGATAMA 3 n=1 Tax=Anisodus acutangulus TaxID=402998 RepID=A0A9Q1N280_9SOLA|nr:hypothetical protein K7X08_009074 [Anisodus acutangulus]
MLPEVIIFIGFRVLEAAGKMVTSACLDGGVDVAGLKRKTNNKDKGDDDNALVLRKVDDEEETQWMKAVTVGCSEVDGFHFPMISCSDVESISQNDLLLLSNKEFGDGKRLPTAYAFALVEDRRPDKIRLRMHLSGEFKQLNTEETEACSRLDYPFYHACFNLQICSLSTISREYVALRSVSSLPFKDLILSAAESNPHTFLIQHFSLQAGLSRKTFGPPGTGKTQTILGLLSAILHATPSRIHSNRVKLSGVKPGPEYPWQTSKSTEHPYRHWGQASPWLAWINPLDQEMPIDGDEGFFPTSGNELKPEVVNSSRKYRVHVLVCAPSNSALDEIVLRILNTGIRDENDRAYSPKIVEQRLSGMDSQTGNRRQGGPVKDKDSIRASILDEAVIVCHFSASSVFTKLNRGFDVVIIDEAAQAAINVIIKQVFLVGDPVQLPATVISPVAGKFGYCVGLFERLQRAGYPVQMLKTQYRMHPEIRNFPSREFYEEALEDGPDVEEQTKRSWHEYRCFGPFCFFDIHEGKESQPSGSVKLLRQKFRETFGVESDKVVDINTVDDFQGREKDVAIFSCVRASKDKGIGFVADYRRMNVGITRARSSVLVVGSASTLRRDARWKYLIVSAEQRNGLYKENLKLMEVEAVHDRPEAPPEDMDIEVPVAAEADQAPQEEHDYGDAGEEGGYDED